MINNEIKNSILFNGIELDEIESMLSCLDAKTKKYNKNSYILKEGDVSDSVGLLISGSVLIIQDDFWGNRNILSKVLPSDIFCEAFAASPGSILTISAISEEDSTVLWLNVSKILTTCPSSCNFHNRMIRNFLSCIAKKNIMLNLKLTHTCQRTTREKVLAYLSSQAQINRNQEFYIPYNRQQLADYLSVDRSALSYELSKLKSDGIINFNKNHFILL